MSSDMFDMKLQRQRWRVLACFLTLAACAITIAGWQLLWFLTDDAFISFRYVSNWVLGIGPTWNPAPFQPVEGYSNFSWVALLSLIWAGTGLEPPVVANFASLGFGLGTLILMSYWLWQVVLAKQPLQSPLQSMAIYVVALLLICTNKSFLTWLSSGLETALSTFLWVCWAYLITRPSTGQFSSARWKSALAASLLALTRPDGLLVWGLTLGWLLASWLFANGPFRRPSKHDLYAGLSLLIAPAHVLWRYYYYHDWLPNTYYAKVGDAWTDMGLDYLLSYFIEYALYIPLVIAACCLVMVLFKRIRVPISLGLCSVVVALTLQAVYYSVIVGGDHFEYRIFHHFVPLLVIAIFAALLNAEVQGKWIVSVLLLWLFAQAVIPWQHWALSKDLYSREKTMRMIVPVAPALPEFISPLTTKFDELQAFMINHSVGMRHQEHKVFFLWYRAIFPSRQANSDMRWDERNILALGSVGVPGWVYPHAAIIDSLALNDRVLAKTEPKIIFGERQMAHSITASNKYISCYRPNFEWKKGDALDILFGRYLKATVSSASPDGEFNITPLFNKRDIAGMDESIRGCESKDWRSADLYAAPFSGD